MRLPVFLAAAALGLTGPVLAQGDSATGYFTAELANSAGVERFAAGGVVWRCAGTRCTAARSSARPLRVCSELRREAGTVTSFSSDSRLLPADQLARCNG